MILNYSKWSQLHEAKGIFSGGLTSDPNFDPSTKRNTIAFQLLDALYRSGDRGLRYTDLQKLVLKIKGIEWSPAKRGHWSTNLSWRGREGLLVRYAQKNELGRWILTPEARAAFIKFDTELTPDELVKISKSAKNPVIRKAAEENPKFPEDLTSWAIDSEDSWL